VTQKKKGPVPLPRRPPHEKGWLPLASPLVPLATLTLITTTLFLHRLNRIYGLKIVLGLTPSTIQQALDPNHSFTLFFPLRIDLLLKTLFNQHLVRRVRKDQFPRQRRALVVAGLDPLDLTIALLVAGLPLEGKPPSRDHPLSAQGPSPRLASKVATATQRSRVIQSESARPLERRCLQLASDSSALFCPKQKDQNQQLLHSDSRRAFAALLRASPTEPDGSLRVLPRCWPC
jgi:hypothetical protein